MAVESISHKKAVYITYVISDLAGEMLERSDQPVGYLHGVQTRLHNKIEKALEGCKVGDSVEVLLEGDEGFGAHDPSLTFTDDLNNVPEEFRRVGAEVEMMNESGENKIFIVSGIEDGKLTVDGNHPFAGKTVNFRVNVVDIREATEDELKSGEVSSMGAPTGMTH